MENGLFSNKLCIYNFKSNKIEDKLERTRPTSNRNLIVAFSTWVLKK